MKYSVLIPCYLMEKPLKELLKKLLLHKELFLEIIVYFDDNSIPENLIIDPLIQYFCGKQNNGLVYARNFLINQAKAENILFLDADTIPLESCFLALKDLSFQDIFAGQELDGFKNNAYQKFRLLFFRQTQGNLAIENSKNLSGLIFGGKLAVFKSLYFDFSFKNYGEDVDFAFRAIKAGYKINYFPELSVFHQREDNFKSLKLMVKNHITYQLKAYHTNEEPLKILIKNQIKFFFISLASALIKHKSIKLAYLCLIFNTYALYIRLKTWTNLNFV